MLAHVSRPKVTSRTPKRAQGNGKPAPPASARLPRVRSLFAQNFLSFGENASIELRPINLLVGPNGAGKSNVIRALELLHAVPNSVPEYLRPAGAGDWLHKGKGASSVLRVGAGLELGPAARTFEYELAVDVAEPARPVIAEETLRRPSDKSMLLLNRRGKGEAKRVGIPAAPEIWEFDRMNAFEPFLHEVRVRENFPDHVAVADVFASWAFYVDGWFGTAAPGKLSQRADLPGERLSPDGANLAHILHERGSDPAFRRRLRETMRDVYEAYEDFHTRLSGGYIHLIIKEGRPGGQVEIPSARLSDGTLRMLALFTLLADPSPPPLICIEEPEIGLHPDAIQALATLLKDAAGRTQLVVTTHSAELVDEFSDQPDAIVVCERVDDATRLHRLDSHALAAWLRDYSLGALWKTGELGGTRW
jgi:predicted ATPase